MIVTVVQMQTPKTRMYLYWVRVTDNNAKSLCFQGFSAFLLSSKRKNNQASLGEVFLFYCCKGIMVRVFRIAYIIQ